MTTIRTKSQSFCVLPFYSYELNSPQDKKNIYCCRLPPGTNIDDIRNDILQNQKNPGCNSCWKLEDQGQLSERNLHNSALDFYWDRDIESIEKDVFHGIYTTKIVKIPTSNLCNGTCVTCGPSLSSAWMKLENRPINYKTLSLEDLSHIQWKDIISLSFVGGEPLLEKVNFQILEKILDFGNDRCFINIVTNGSVSLSPGQVDLLKKFENINLCLSIDGIGKRFDYLRFPLKWSDLIKNLETFRQITENISVSCMISNISIFYLDETLNWFRSENLRYLCKQIIEPYYFSPGNLPDPVKNQLLDDTENFDEMKSFLNCGQFSDENWQRCQQEITRQDFLKKISIEDFLPDIKFTKLV